MFDWRSMDDICPSGLSSLIRHDLCIFSLFDFIIGGFGYVGRFHIGVQPKKSTPSFKWICFFPVAR